MLEMAEEGKNGGMYVDLAEQFRNNDHEVTIMAPDNEHAECYVRRERGMRVVRVNSKATQGIPNMIKKGIALATLGYYFKKAYKRYLKNDSFDWIFMPTPPITLSSLAKYIKKRTEAKYYLILRDIHPQSVWSIGLVKHKWMYYYLDQKARKGYQSSDLIGCMSQGNIDFIQNQYPNMKMGKPVMLYNWVIEPTVKDRDLRIRNKWGLKDKFVALFGGNLGKGQRIENIAWLAEHYINQEDIIFLIIAKGVEKIRFEKIAEKKKLSNIQFLDFMPQKDYLDLVMSVDLGLVSINENYSVPTCPSKAISYMASGIPVFAMINPNSDYGQWIEDAGAGYWTIGSDKERTIELFDKLYNDSSVRKSMGENGRQYYLAHCTPERAYDTMIKQMIYFF